MNGVIEVVGIEIELEESFKRGLASKSSAQSESPPLNIIWEKLVELVQNFFNQIVFAVEARADEQSNDAANKNEQRIEEADSKNSHAGE